MKNREKQTIGAGCAELATGAGRVMSREQMLENVNRFYRSRPPGGGRPPGDLTRRLQGGETIYWRRRSGKVASFFRCLLR